MKQSDFLTSMRLICHSMSLATFIENDAMPKMFIFLQNQGFSPAKIGHN